jgi:hypothetical protein
MLKVPSLATYVWGEDRMGLYFDGKLIAQGQDVDSRAVLDAIGVPTAHKSASTPWLRRAKCLPEALAEVVCMKETA